MADYSELKRLAESFPDYEWDSNQTPFFNGPSGESLRGESTGFYCVYGPDFEIEGESYEGVILVESCPSDQAKFICKAKTGILELISEVARLNADNASLRGSCAKLGAEHAGMVRTVRKANTELDRLKKFEDWFVRTDDVGRSLAETFRAERDQAIEKLNGLRKDKDRIDALEANFWDVRHTSTQVGMEGDTSQSIEIVGSWMDAPRERVIGENYNENLRAAIDQAMAADAYPPARPEYPELDDGVIPDFTPGSGNKARRRAESLGIEYPPAAKAAKP